MGWRFRKLFRKGPLQASISKNGIGYSIGIQGFRVGLTSSRQYYISLGIPGSGLYWIKYFGKTAQNQNKVNEPLDEE